MAVDARRFDGMVAIVTGGGGNVGKAIARRLAREGAAVVVADCCTETASACAGEIEACGGRALSVPTDVTKVDEVQRLMTRALEVFGRVDVLVNNAALLGRAGVLDLSVETWDRFMDVNLKGPFLCSQAAARWWTTEGVPGVIINIGSVESLVAFPDQVHYATSKGGVLMMTRALALDLSPHGIRVNAVGPGTIEQPSLAQDPARRARYEAMYPLGRLGKADDVAGAVSYLASSDAAWVTGQILYVDGGYVVR